MLRLTSVKPEEVSILRAFAERTFRIAFEPYNDPVRFEAYCAQSFSKEQITRELENPASFFWFAWEGEILVAYLKINTDRHPVELNSQNTLQVERLYVDPAFQGRRIGEQLLDFAAQFAVEKGGDWIWLSVWQENPPAVRFYERCGYQIFGTKTFWLGDEAQTDWLMRKKV